MGLKIHRCNETIKYESSKKQIYVMSKFGLEGLPSI